MNAFIKHPIAIPISFSSLEDSSVKILTEKDIELKNLSQGGLIFQSKSAVVAGDLIRVEIPIDAQPFRATGVVKWCRLEGQQYVIGVQFIGEKSRFTLRMIEQICYIKEYQKAVLQGEGRQLSEDEAALEWIHKYSDQFPAF